MQTGKWMVPALFATGLALCTGARAGILNGDFSAGFTGWEGAVEQDPGGVTFMPPAAFTDFPANFILGGGGTGATIATSFFDNDVFAVDLSQAFQMDPLSAPGAQLTLRYILGVEVTDPVDDFFAADLMDLSGIPLPTLDLFATAPGSDCSYDPLTGIGECDVTAWAGRDVDLTFTIEDIDSLFAAGPTDDRLFVDQITITETLAPVPSPGTLLLLGLGLAVLGFRLRYRR